MNHAVECDQVPSELMDGEVVVQPVNESSAPTFGSHHCHQVERYEEHQEHCCSDYASSEPFAEYESRPDVVVVLRERYPEAHKSPSDERLQSQKQSLILSGRACSR